MAIHNSARPRFRAPHLVAPEVIVVLDMLRFRALVTEQVARRLNGSTEDALATLDRLSGLGVVRREPNWIVGTELWTATRIGARAVKDRRRVRYLWPGGLPHDLALVDLADYLRRQHPCASWRTEREIASDRHRTARTGDRVDTRHRPDGLLILHGQRIAIELELSTKSEPEAYARICRWYAEQPDIDGLRWYVGSRSIWARIALEIDRHGLDADLGIELHALPPAVAVRGWSSEWVRQCE